MMYQIEPVAILSSPYQEKFAIPRQPGLVPAARGRVWLQGAYNNAHCIQGIEGFSHLWLQFIFHQTQAQGWRPLVRPPRLGGNQKVGVFATRSSFRPNGLGLSVVKLESVGNLDGQWFLEVSGIDLLDQTPIIDIKPYIAYSDSLQGAQSGFAQHSPELMQVQLQPAVVQALHAKPELKLLIEQVLAQDPRPAYHRQSHSPDQPPRNYGARLADHNVKWYVEGNLAIVTAVTRC